MWTFHSLLRCVVNKKMHSDFFCIRSKRELRKNTLSQIWTGNHFTFLICSAPKRLPLDSEKQLRVYTSSHICHIHNLVPRHSTPISIDLVNSWCCVPQTDVQGLKMKQCSLRDVPSVWENCISRTHLSGRVHRRLWGTCNNRTMVPHKEIQWNNGTPQEKF